MVASIRNNVALIIKVCSKSLESISRFAYNFFIFHPISIIFWHIKGIAEHFM